MSTPDIAEQSGRASSAPETRSGALFGWLWRDYLGRHKLWLGIAVVFMAIEGSMLAAVSWIIGPMFDRVFIAGEPGALAWVGTAIAAIFLTRAVTSVIQRVILTRVSQRVAGQLRADLLRHLMTLDMAFHQRHPPGTLIERVQGDVGAINQVWTGIVLGLGRDAVAVVALFAVALSVDWRWTLIAMIGLPALMLPALAAQGFVRGRARTAREAAAAMSTRLDEVFHGIAPVKLNGLEEYQSRRYDALTETRVQAEVNAALGQATIPALIDIMAGIGFVAVLIFGAAEIAGGDKSVGEFMTFFSAMLLTFEPLRRLGNIAGLWQAAAASVERLFALFAEHPTLREAARPAAPPVGAPEIVFRDVHLSYGDLPALSGASFTARPGETTALVGASGAGKSTVFNLLTRLVEPQSGKIAIGGVPVGAMALADLRGLFSVVTQDAALFDESLRENILLAGGGRAADLDEVLTAAHVADFLPRLPAGLDSPAGPRGSNLSGGQRQRIAIARALLRDTAVLLLDEATSALDTRSEAIVQDALDRLAEGRTTLVIAHRLSTVRNADRIVVMDRGRVVDEGPHDDLIARGGLYADLYAMQFRDRSPISEGEGDPP